MSQDALRQAIGEARAGLLAQPEAGGFLDRFFGPGFLEAKRYVPGTVHSVRASVNHFLEEQGFQLRRNRGELTVWEPAQDVLSRIRRFFGAGPYRLPREIDIEVQIVELAG